MLGMVLGASVIGLFLMWLVYMLPVEPMVKNMIGSYETIRKQDTWDDDYLATLEWAEILDTGTNIIMYHEVIYPNTEHAFVDSLLAPGGNTWNDMIGDWTAGLMDFAENREYTEKNTVTYARYWHGYLVLLKPLFSFMTLEGIYVINTIVLAGLCLAVLYFMYKRLGLYSLAYLVALFTMHPENIVVSFQLSSIFYALNITLLLLLVKKTWSMSPETAWHVIHPSHEYIILNCKGMKGVDFVFVEPHYDYIEIERNTLKIEGCYFNVERITDVYNMKYCYMEEIFEDEE